MRATITREELREKIERGDDFLLVETLAPEYYRHTHLPKAINIPPDQVEELAPQMLPDKSADIVVYCANPN
jgi:rhodanese-related sulfurtransferase